MGRKIHQVGIPLTKLEFVVELQVGAQIIGVCGFEHSTLLSVFFDKEKKEARVEKRYFLCLRPEIDEVPEKIVSDKKMLKPLGFVEKTDAQSRIVAYYIFEVIPQPRRIEWPTKYKH